MISDTAQLLFWASSDPDAQALAQELHRLATQSARAAQLCRDPGAVRAALQEETNTTLCLLYTAPERHLARCIAAADDAATDLGSATAQWKRETEALCTLFRQNRKRCVVFETSHLHRHAPVALDRLRLKAPAQNPLGTSTLWASDDAPLLILMAQAHLQSQSALETLTEELAACTLLLSNGDTLSAALPANAALVAFRSQQRHRDAAVATHHQTVQRLEAELAEKNAANRELQDEKAAVETAAEALRTQVERAREAQDIVMQQNTLVLAERRQLAEEKTRLAHDIDTARQDHRAQLEKAGALEAEIDRIMMSRSMRLTAPLRALAKLLGRAPDV